ncbi:MAG: hypothetical protein WAM91_17095 [Candidatus Acidiferrales bacterium]
MGIAVVPLDRQGRVQRNLQVLSILWLVCGSLEILAGVVLFVVANVLFGIAMHLNGGAGGAEPFVHTILTIVGTAVGIKGILGIVAGWGLLQRETWARALIIVMGFLGILHIPLGTALGIYTIWVLLPNESAEEYERLALAA